MSNKTMSRTDQKLENWTDEIECQIDRAKEIAEDLDILKKEMLDWKDQKPVAAEYGAIATLANPVLKDLKTALSNIQDTRLEIDSAIKNAQKLIDFLEGECNE